MAKKIAKKKVQKKTSAGQQPSQTKGAKASKWSASTQEIWLAGLGAFALAQDEGGKLLKEGAKAIEGTGKRVVGEGTKLFERLVKEGGKVQSAGRKIAEEAVGDVRENVTERASKVRQGAQANWDRLEKVFEERVAKALSRLGVPTSDEIETLSAHVVKLSRQVDQLAATHKAPAGTQPATAKTVAKKVAKKKAVKKKASTAGQNATSTPKQS